MVISSFIVFTVFLLLFLFVLYFDRRNLFLGIFFIATGLSFIFYIMALITNNATDNNFVYNLGVVLLVIAIVIIYTITNCSSNNVFIQFILCLLKEKD